MEYPVDGNRVKALHLIDLLIIFFAQVVELVDTPDLGSGAARYVGSSPILGTSAEIFSEMEVSPFYFLRKSHPYLSYF